MVKTYDLVVIGTCSAATMAASICRAADWKVAVVDELPFGGTCPLRGCDPKKVLVGAAAALDHVRRLRGKGVATETRIDWRELIAFNAKKNCPLSRVLAGAQIDLPAQLVAAAHGAK